MLKKNYALIILPTTIQETGTTDPMKITHVQPTEMQNITI